MKLNEKRVDLIIDYVMPYYTDCSKCPARQFCDEHEDEFEECTETVKAYVRELEEGEEE